MVSDHLVGKTDHAIAIYQAIVEGLEACGEFRIHAQKTRIAFITRMTFGGVSLARNWVDLSFILPVPVDDPRIRKLDLFGPTSWGMVVRLTRLEEVDGAVRGWLCEAWRRGNQETLDPKAEVTPLTGSLLAVFRTGFRARVDQIDGEPVVFLPGYVADALAMVDWVTTKMGGVEDRAVLSRVGGRAFVDVPPGTGIGVGEELDVFLGPADWTGRS